MKIGISLKIDVSKLDKSRFFKGEKGIYADLTTFVDTENVSQYGDNGIINQSVSKEERDNGVQLPILGNAKIFYTGQQQHSNQQPQGQQQKNTGQRDSYNDSEDDIPF